MFDDDIAVVYSKEDCPWCEKMVDLLKDQGFIVKKLTLDVDYTKEQLMARLGTKKVTVPQVYIENQLVGGYDHVYAYFNMKKAMLA